MKKRFIFSIISMCILLMTIGFTYGYYSTSKRLNQKPKGNITELDIQTNLTGDEKEISDKITSETNIKYNIRYLKCDYEKSEITKPDNIMLNMTKDELESYIDNNEPSWQLRNLSRDEVVITIDKDEKCPNHNVIDHYIIGIKNNYIAIFHVNVNGEYIKTEKVTDTPIETLRKKDLEELNKGIRVNTEEEIDSIIENFIS